MFIVGMNNQSKRMGPGCMLNQLCKQNLNCLDLPSETEIRQAISTLAAQQKKGQIPSLSTKQRGIAEPYASTIIEIAETHSNFKPEEAWNFFLQKHPNTTAEDYPDKAKMKAKFSVEKRKRKN